MTITSMAAVVSSAALLIVPLVAQQPDTRAQYAGQTWVGLLVSASCPSTGSSPADAQSDLSTSDRVTTPAVDDAGVRGSAQTNSDGNGPHAASKVPFTGDIEASRNDREDPGWRTAKRQAAHLGEPCRVTAATDRFALLLPEGRTVRFDQLANQKIMDHLRSENRAAKPRIFRVRVTGKLQDRLIAIDSVEW